MSLVRAVGAMNFVGAYTCTHGGRLKSGPFNLEPNDSSIKLFHFQGPLHSLCFITLVVLLVLV